MLYQLALCAAILACANAEHERGQDRVATANSDALSGSALHSHVVQLHKHEHERRAIEADNLHDNEEHVRGSELEEDASDSLGEYGCVWDDTGAGDADRMELNCDRLNEDECIAAGNGNKDARCVWKAKNHAKGAHKDTITNAGKEQSMAKKVAADDRMDADFDEDAMQAPLGCLWDGSGCAHDMCDQEQMVSRCDDLSHSKASCLGTMGVERRCFWSHGSADDARKAAVAMKIMGLAVDLPETNEEVEVVADAGNRHNANANEVEQIAEDAAPQLGCQWDGSGCVGGQCDEEAMNARCAKLSHSKTSCLGSMGQDARCFWSHGAADEEEFEHFKPEELNVVADAGNRHNANANEVEEIAEDNVPQLGCVWDKSGCVQGQCDMESMTARCADLSHSKAACLGDMGKERRCVWSHGADDAKMEDVLNGGFEGALQNMKVSTMDILLAAAFVVTAAFALQRLYRWWADRGYIKLAEEPHDVEPLLMTQV